MPWFVRSVEDNDSYTPDETPDYSKSPDKFTLKFHFGGQFQSRPMCYAGRSIRYVDMCDVDEMSLLEIGNMIEECGESGYPYVASYKQPESEFESGLCPLTNDENVLQMCNGLPPTKTMYVYVISQIVGSEEYLPSQQYDLSFIDDHMEIEFEKQQIEQMLDLESMYRDLSDHEDVENALVPEVDNILVDDHESDHGSDQGSFHGDSSNMNSSDDDVNAFKKGMPKAGTFGKCDFDITTITGFVDAEQMLEGPEAEFSDYGGSEEERMAANSTDEEEMNYPVFNEETDMGDPSFEL